MARKKKKNSTGDFIFIVVFLILIAISISYVYKLEKTTSPNNKINSSNNLTPNEMEDQPIKSDKTNDKVEEKKDNPNTPSTTEDKQEKVLPNLLQCTQLKDNNSINVTINLKDGKITKLTQEITNNYNNEDDANIFYQGMKGEIEEGMYKSKDGLQASVNMSGKSVNVKMIYDYLNGGENYTPLGSISTYDDIKNYYTNAGYKCK